MSIHRHHNKNNNDTGSDFLYISHLCVTYSFYIFMTICTLFLFFLMPTYIVKHTLSCLEVICHLNLFYYISVTFSVCMNKNPKGTMQRADGACAGSLRPQAAAGRRLCTEARVRHCGNLPCRLVAGCLSQAAVGRPVSAW